MPTYNFRQHASMPGQVRINCPNCGQVTDIDTELLFLMPSTEAEPVELSVHPFPIEQEVCCLIRKASTA